MIRLTIRCNTPGKQEFSIEADEPATVDVPQIAANAIAAEVYKGIDPDPDDLVGGFDGTIESHSWTTVDNEG